MANDNLDFISISSSFVDRLLPAANANYVKIYLYTLRQFSLGNKMSAAKMAQSLGVLKTDVTRAWEYWQLAGEINIDGDYKSGADFYIEFLDTREISCHTADAKVSQSNSVDLQITQSESLPKAHHTNSRPSHKKNLTIARMAANEGLIQHALKKLQKPELNRTDAMALCAMHEDFGMPLEVIYMLLDYCVDAGNKTISSVQKVAVEWVDKGIVTVEKAEQYLHESQVKKTEVKPTANFAAKKGTRFNNFSKGDPQYELNYEEFERISFLKQLAEPDRSKGVKKDA